jgi:dipeptidase E
MGETRDERLAQFMEENDTDVVCLREGAWLEVSGRDLTIGGRHGGKLFEPSGAQIELPHAGAVSIT